MSKCQPAELLKWICIHLTFNNYSNLYSELVVHYFCLALESYMDIDRLLCLP